MGKFVSLYNSVFDKVGRLTKRNGFAPLAALPDATSRYTTTFNGNLTAIGNKFEAFAEGPGLWVNKGTIEPVQVETLSLVRNNTNQTTLDTALADNGLICTVYTDNVPVGSTNTVAIAKYVIADSVTGQNIVAPSPIVSTYGTVSFSSKVFTLGNKFVMVFAATNGTTYRLQYQAINTFAPTVVSSVTDVTTSLSPSASGAFDGVVANDTLFLSWNGGANSGIKANYITNILNLASDVVIASTTASIVSVTADTTGATPVIWTSTYIAGSQTGSFVATNQILSTLFSARNYVGTNTSTVLNLASTAQGGNLNLMYEQQNNYNTGSGNYTNVLNKLTVNQTGSASATSVMARGVGLASKGFLVGSSAYVLSTYSSPEQPSYFLINTSSAVIAKLAYSNGYGYYNQGLPSVTVNSLTAYVGYVLKDSIEAVNKNVNVSSGSNVTGIYSQTGLNLAKFSYGSSRFSSCEIGQNLNMSGGFTLAYDGYSPSENNFFLYPEIVQLSGGIVGTMAQATYFYQAVYAWTDNQGNVFRSAPSIPESVIVGSGTTSINVTVPTLRLTYKVANPVKIEIYRWSTLQQSFYQITSVQKPLLNNPNIDSVDFLDTQPDANIIGNSLIYTTGGVIENTSPPAAKEVSLFDSRLWLIDAENPNVLWFSKPVIQSTPVEMSDLFTKYIAPNAGAQGDTGPMKCIAPMDDKLIIFKKNAIYFINGVGPDITGASNQYSEPVFIIGTVGCDNQNSIILVPNGLMFQSDKGIWLLGRDLSTKYIGADVDNFKTIAVRSSLVIPGTNQVRFTMDNGQTLMYDYYVDQWSVFNTIAGTGIASTLYQNLHTYLNRDGTVYQESPGTYLDGSNPVVMSFKTGWVSLAGLQGYKRSYYMFLLANYISPHRLTVGLAHDYDESVTQLATIIPDNYSGPWGSGTSWGSVTTWGGNTTREQWQINFEQQQCQSFQISLNEYYDSTMGQPAGAGLTISGISLIAGLKSQYPKNIPAVNRTS